MLKHILVHTAHKALLSLVFGLIVALVLVWPFSVLEQGASKLLPENASLQNVLVPNKVSNKFDGHRVGLICFMAVASACSFNAITSVVLSCCYPQSKRTCAVFGVLMVLVFVCVAIVVNLFNSTSTYELTTLTTTLAVVLPNIALPLLLRHRNGRVVTIGTFAMMLLSCVTVLLYQMVIIPAYFQTGSILIPIIIRTVGHTGIKLLFMALMFRIAKLFPQANPQAIHVIFIPPIVYSTMLGRFMQVSSNNLLLVVITELILVVFEFSETYGYMRLNAAFALVHDVVDSVLPTAPSGLKVVTRTSTPTKPNELELESRSAPIESRKASFALVGHTPLPVDTYANVVNCLAVVETASIVISAAFMLLVRANPYSSTDKPVSHGRVLTNAAILIVFEAFISDIFVTWFNATHEDPVHKVNLMRSWKTRDKRLDLVLLFFLGAIGTHVAFVVLRTLCVVYDNDNTILIRC